ncbi:unnamed protein product [Gongylonema pulchrum]|uniref:Fucosyltransferase n=1 Tax=Gongylonema pulchrum TaxID=637853 RepID=A0A183ELQ6_9BILA|nr:unnamed protein product [Gongylonema pulchrum]
MLLYAPFLRGNPFETRSRGARSLRFREGQKLMIMWTTFFKQHPRNRMHLLDECPDLIDKCYLTDDRQLADSADAIVFHYMDHDFLLDDLPKVRHPSQRYVFLTVEAPPSYRILQSRRNLRTPANFFNWTMTYRYDSDVPWIYGGYWVSPERSKELGFTPENLPFDEQTILENKTGAIFWLVYIMIDKYGACAENPYKRDACARSAECEKDLGSMNFFYIAIENTVCKNYITEKYFERYHLPSVPIVMRRKTYEKFVTNLPSLFWILPN